MFNIIYFTSDLHLGHKGIITMQNRPFENVVEMNRTIINNYNSCVNQDDTVYILGDISHHMTVEAVNEIIASLKGKKYLIKGNHDKNYDDRLFEGICDFKEIAVNGSNIVLMHYPMMSWHKSRKGSIQLHGHIHGDETYNISNRDKGIKRYDVGVDANKFMPVSIKQIQEYFHAEEDIQLDETILTIEWRKSDILAAMKEQGIEGTNEQFKDFMNSSRKNVRMIEESSIATGWDMIHSIIRDMKDNES